jgi:hypothetical protein
MRTRKIVKRVAGVALIAAGIILGLWLGVWVLFIGGIVAVVEGIRATPVDAMRIATGVLRILVASPVGWWIFLALSFIGRLCWV